MFEYIFKNQKLSSYISLICLIVLVFGIQIYLFKKVEVENKDITYHLNMAQKMLENNSIVSPNIPSHISARPLYHLLAITFSIITGASLITSGYYLVLLLSYLILAITIYKALIAATIESENNSFSNHALIISLTLCLMLVGPVSLFSFPKFYFGYIGITVYHNPTQILAKPLSLITFLLLADSLNRTASSMKFKLCLGLISILLLLTKPSYIICLIPSIFLFAMLKLYKREPINLSLIFFFLAANAMVLAWQYWLTYGYGLNNQDHNKIIFAPFLVMRHFADFSQLLPRLIASVLFPITVYLVFFDAAKKDATLNLAWLTFGVSLFYTYFLAESGSRLYDGNFLWGSQTCLFILFFASTIFLIKEKKMLPIRKNLMSSFLCIITFSLHLLSGLLNYFSIWWLSGIFQGIQL